MIGSGFLAQVIDDDPAMVIGINPGDLDFCNKGPVKKVLPTASQYSRGDDEGGRACGAGAPD